MSGRLVASEGIWAEAAAWGWESAAEGSGSVEIPEAAAGQGSAAGS